MTETRWFDCHESKQRLAEDLVSEGHLPAAEDVLRFFEKPWKWDPEWNQFTLYRTTKYFDEVLSDVQRVVLFCHVRMDQSEFCWVIAQALELSGLVSVRWALNGPDIHADGKRMTDDGFLANLLSVVQGHSTIGDKVLGILEHEPPLVTTA